MTSESPQTKIKFYAFLLRLFRISVKCLPAAIVVRAGRIVGYVASIVCYRDRVIAEAQIQFALYRPVMGASNYSALSRTPRKLARAAFAEFGVSMAELLRYETFLATRPGAALLPGPNDFLYIAESGTEFLADCTSRHQSALALSGHIGNFELLAAYYIKRGFPLSALGRAPNYEILTAVLDTIRKEYGVITIWRNDRKSTLKLLRSIRDGGMMGALIDQDSNLQNSFSPFFGVPAACPISIVKIAIKYNLPITTNFIVRTSYFHHHVYCEEIKYDASHPSALQVILDTYNARLEQLIFQYPEQWVWWHRRWRRRADVDYDKHPELLRGTASYLEWLDQEQRSY